MSIWQPDVDGVIAYLTEHGQPDMAAMVRRLHQSEVTQRRAAETILADFYRLKDKHEPGHYRDHAPTWTGD